MSDLSPQTRRLLELAREGDPMPRRRRARLETKFFARLAGGVVVGIAADAAWGKAVPFFGALTKGIAGVALVSSLGAGGYFAVHALRHDLAIMHTSDRTHGTNAPSTHAMPAAQPVAPEPAPRPTMAPIAQPMAPEPKVVAALRASSDDRREVSTRRTVATPAVARASRAASHGPVATAPAVAAQNPAPEPAVAPTPPEQAAPARPPSTLSEETHLLAEADQALRSGDTGRAVALLDEHATRYPDGTLGPERGAERIVALCKMGRTDPDTVNTYLAAHPNSSFSDRIQHACARILSRSKRAAR